uniref:WAT1-related protein n=1 Tax=Davidia involucrata TaxID=16924 RepID=A0A5B7BQI2_DAVIN
MDRKKPYLAVILIQSIYAAMFLLSKAAFDVGMNTYVFVFYRQAAATVFLAPLAMFFEWKIAPPLSFVTFCKIFMLSLCGITLSLNFYGVGLIYTSASLAAAATNCLPVITFFLSVLFRMEMMRLRTIPGIAKVAGIAICMAGAATIALYRGPYMKLSLHHHLFGHHHSQEHQLHVPHSTAWIKGCFLMLISNIFWGLWLVLQARVMKSYPTKLLFTTLQCFLSSIQSFVVAISLERDPYEWKLGWNVRLVAVAYCVSKNKTLTFALPSPITLFD